ncbi:hypothetical protein MCA2228 [Methylococcus capsulatus str. Bath]|uniref:Uncharacterized protein n=1 Tax=Methylococcus capsulatus (strain ATCC 33009 / NCIMB 11132 / Bath) TaxID=243233 RepID=Q605Q1_METCA|nr:hypothetical protein MCA2228 [Methylococcus capsulatus str. Bath]
MAQRGLLRRRRLRLEAMTVHRERRCAALAGFAAEKSNTSPGFVPDARTRLG